LIQVSITTLKEVLIQSKGENDWQIRVQISFTEELPVPTTTAIAYQGKIRKRNNAPSGIIH
jgi:hypothetical protein